MYVPIDFFFLLFFHIFFFFIDFFIDFSFFICPITVTNASHVFYVVQL